MTKPTPVYLELGKAKVFASALDWPGWSRAGKTEEAALETLAAYAPRFAPVAEAAGVRFPKSAGDSFTIVERLTGGGGTDFGVLGEVAIADREPVTAAQAKRLASILTAAWALFDEVAAVTPAELRKGPRGGGRDRDKMINHVLEAEAAYARMIGLKIKPPALGDTAAIEALRADVLGVIGRASDGTPPTEKRWPTRYAARRFAWHVLDHVWEMQDRTES
jgi:hypothetical protein